MANTIVFGTDKAAIVPDATSVGTGAAQAVHPDPSAIRTGAAHVAALIPLNIGGDAWPFADSSEDRFGIEVASPIEDAPVVAPGGEAPCAEESESDFNANAFSEVHKCCLGGS